ncbi:MAG: hypothetical protein RSF70_08785, partial [Ruthenibacterium sp.]
NKGKTTIDELSHSIAQVTPTAAAMQVSFYQVGAALSTITAQGVPTAQATTQLNSLFAELGKSGTIASDNLMAAAEGTKYAGKGFSELMKDGVPLSELLLLMADYAGENGKSMLDMFGSIESGRAALALVNEDGKTYTKNLDAMSTKTDVVTDAYSKMMNTFAAKKDVIIESSKNIAIAAYRYIEKPLKSAADTAIKSIQSLTNFVKKNGDKITATLKDVATAVASATAGFIAFKTVQSAIAVIDGLTRAYQTVSASLTAYTVALAASAAMEARGIGVGKLLAASLKTTELLIGALTGQITIATAATTIFHTVVAAISAHPVIAVATAVAALTAGLVGLALLTKSEQSAGEAAIETAQRHRDAIAEKSAAFKELQEAQAITAISDLVQIDNAERLSQKLQAVTSATGFVDEKNRGMAAFILGELNEALGTEYEMRDGQITQYQVLQGEIAKTIAAKRAEIMLAAEEEVYKQALMDRMTVQQQAADQAIAISQAKAEQADLEKQHLSEIAAIEELNALAGNAHLGEIQVCAALKRESWYQELEALKVNIAGQEAEYAKSQSDVAGYYSTIANFENAAASLQAGNVEQCIAMLNQQNNGYRTAKDVVALTAAEQQQVLGQQYANQLVQLASYMKAYNQGQAGFNLEELSRLQEQAKSCGLESEKVGVAIVDGQIIGLNGKKIPLNDTIQTLADGAISIAKNAAPDFVPTGANMAAGVATGIRSGTSGAVQAAISLVEQAIAAANKKAQIKSPSRVTMKSGEYLAEGYEVGMENRKADVEKSGAALMQSALPETSRSWNNNWTARFGEQMYSAAMARQHRNVGAQMLEMPTAPAGQTIIQNDNSINPIFNQPMQAPDEIARALRLSARRELAGAR